MTPSQYQATWTGKEIPNNSGGFVGECVSAVARFAQEVQGVPNADNVFYCQASGGARDLWENPTSLLLAHYDKVSTPQLYDIAVWGSNLGKYGDTQIYWGDNKQFGQYGTPVFLPAEIRPLSASPLGYLRLKGENDMPNDGDIDNAYLQSNGRTATEQEKADYRVKPWSAPDGLYYGKIRVDFANTQEALKEAQNAPPSGYKPYTPPPLFTKE